MNPAISRCRRFYFLHLAPPVIAGLSLLWLIDLAALDWRISNLFFDTASMQFPLRNSPWLEIMLHQWVKYVVVAFAVVIAGLMMVSLLSQRLLQYRRVLIFLVMGITLSSASISWLKVATGQHCPYDLQVYGGDMPYVGLLETRPDNMPPGRCWPGGHASTGFSLFGVYFAATWLGYVVTARWLLAGTVMLGLALGFGRVMQGAHFLSHNLWTALVCWLVTLTLYELLLRRYSPPQLP